jgi:hypothetical protein
MENNESFYDIDRNVDSSRGLNMVMCGAKGCKCPAVNIHKDLDVVILGGKEEGYSSWSKEQFAIMAKAIKEGKFDEYIKEH